MTPALSLATQARDAAPSMPPTFWGEVRYTYQAGRLVLVVVEERLKP